jgi:hypothetical protein
MSSGRNDVAMSADSPPRGRENAHATAKMRDVAAAAGVSRATVSNFLNNPHLVAAGTRSRIERAVHELSFQPDQNARAARGRRRPGGKNSEGNRGHNRGTCQPENAAIDQALPGPGQKTTRGGVDVKPGQHVTVQVGPEVLSGLVDAVMPDNSCFWVWADNGMGRRLFEASAVTSIDLTGR